MKFAKIAWKDISSIFRNRLIRVSVIAIIIVPLLYSLLYLAAFWDPYSRLDKLPVAVVNLDKGSENDGKAVNYGDDIVKDLKENKEVGWQFTTLQQAKDGLEGSKYYSMFVIPEDFSGKIISSKDHKPESPEIKFVPNDKKNFLASQIGGKVELAIQQKITSNISKEFTKVTFDNMYELKDGMQQAADGSKKLYDGIDTLGSNVPTMADGVLQLKDGSNKLSDGLSQLKDKTSAMPSGVSQLYSGSNQITGGLGQLKAATGIPALLDGSNQITNGLGMLNDKVKQGQETVIGLGLDKIDPNKVLNVENLQKIKSVIAAGKKLSDADLSVLNSLNTSSVKLVEGTISDIKQLTSDEGINVLMSKPSIQLVLSQMDFSKPENQQSLATRVQNADKLVSDANSIQAALLKLKNNEPQLFTQLQSMDINNELKTMPVIISSLNNLSSASKLITKSDVALVQGILNDPTKLSNQLAAMDKTKNDLNGLMNQIATMQSNDTLNNALKAIAVKLGTSKAQGEQSVQLSATERDAMLQYMASVNNLTNEFTQYKPEIDGMMTQLNSYEQAAKDKMAVVQANPQSARALGSLLTNYDATMGLVNSKLPLLNAVGAALQKPDNVSALSTLISGINSIQTDLAKNQDNLALINDLITSTQDPKVQALLPKVAKIKSDIDSAKPLIDKLNTPETLAMLEKAPELAGQVKGLQQDIKNNADILEIADRTLTQGNLETAQNLLASIPELTNGVQKLYDGSTQVTGGLTTVNGAVNQLYDGSIQVAGGLGQLNGSVPSLISGVNQLNDGAGKLSNGLGELNGKMPELKDGVVKLTDGSKELSDKLSDGSNKLNNNLKNSSEEMGTFISEPVKVTTEAINTVKDYGTGFTPYFIPLSLWVGAIMMFFVISPKVADGMNAGSASRVLGKYFSYTFIGLLQAVLVSVVVLFLGLKPNNIIAYFGFNILLSFTFIAIIQALISLLGDAGRLLAIVLLIFNLTTCAGTFPLELVPKFFTVLNPYLPFTYAIAGLRESIAGSDFSVIISSSLFLLAYLVVFIIIAVVFIDRGEKFVRLIEGKKEELAA